MTWVDPLRHVHYVGGIITPRWKCFRCKKSSPWNEAIDHTEACAKEEAEDRDINLALLRNETMLRRDAQVDAAWERNR